MNNNTLMLVLLAVDLFLFSQILTAELKFYHFILVIWLFSTHRFLYGMLTCRE